MRNKFDQFHEMERRRQFKERFPKVRNASILLMIAIAVIVMIATFISLVGS